VSWFDKAKGIKIISLTFTKFVFEMGHRMIIHHSHHINAYMK